MKIFNNVNWKWKFSVVCACLVAVYSFRQKEGLHVASPDAVIMKYTAPPLPSSFSFAGEAVPLQDTEIREQWDREVLYNYYQPNSILYIIKLSKRYFPQIEAQLKKNGIPEDMKYLCVAESNLQLLVSKAGAAGFWQFMPSTAPGFGLEVNSYVDERYHIEKSTEAACKYLRKAYEQLGSWTAAAASYNCGMGAYAGQANFQKTRNYYDLLLPEETNRYIFRILTFKYFLEQADGLGFIIGQSDGYLPQQFPTIEVNSSIPDLAAFATAHGSNYRLLKRHNAWIRGKTLPVPPGKKYTLVLPSVNR
ncbi:lytic transglycosylase domain-containing protein [Terrimonas sp. NA20]|uniref:Lytic transglycosylase domain-containing protein n=1 Tax=Terrimonas ginsenosidimutans TaxID=2908004 RepID=A0ABS9KXV4_9BACT|nr:lytic transglycosylase domain-containing protein [Terrimonas ginsenosidimutans]MCG2617064.1 lytic transglycosylase domain-containing protein [Terrimonas ginsenosidimutans]